jgi:hypothetical protein
MSSPWTWASLGGAVVAVAFSVTFMVNRPAPARAAAARASGSPAVVPAPAPSSTAEPAADRVGRTIDLLPYVDLARDTVGGQWRLDGGALICDASHRARVGIRYRVPREYDFRVQFTQVDGENCAAQMFTAANPAALVLGGWKRTVTGFQQIDNKWANANPTGVRGLRWDNGRKHTSVVRVRRQSIEAWLDGKLITSHKTDGSDLSNRDWDVPGYALGVGSEVSSTIFHAVELIEVGGGTETASR